MDTFGGLIMDAVLDAIVPNSELNFENFSVTAHTVKNTSTVVISVKVQTNMAITRQTAYFIFREAYKHLTNEKPVIKPLVPCKSDPFMMVHKGFNSFNRYDYEHYDHFTVHTSLPEIPSKEAEEEFNACTALGKLGGNEQKYFWEWSKEDANIIG